MRIFVTGATGFIGSYVLASALNAGHHVVALRRNINSIPVISLSRQPFWIDGDLATFNSSILQNIDVVLHLASAGVSPKQACLETMINVNISNSLRLLGLCIEYGVPRCVVAGSSLEYGTAANNYMHIPPNSSLEPLNLYAASKSAAFQLMRAFAISHNLEFFYGRIFSAYGLGQFEENFWPSLRRAALSGSDFHMTSGKQVCDFIPVTAVADHLVTACSRSDVRAGKPVVVNIGTGLARELYEFAQDEWKRLGATGKLIPGALKDRSDQLLRCVPDITGLDFTLPLQS